MCLEVRAANLKWRNRISILLLSPESVVFCLCALFQSLLCSYCCVLAPPTISQSASDWNSSAPLTNGILVHPQIMFYDLLYWVKQHHTGKLDSKICHSWVRVCVFVRAVRGLSCLVWQNRWTRAHTHYPCHEEKITTTSWASIQRHEAI